MGLGHNGQGPFSCTEGPAAPRWSQNLFLNRRITFPEAAGSRCRSQVARFIGVCSIGLGINRAVTNALYVLLPSLRWMYQLYCVGGALAATADNFLLSKYVAFQVPPERTDR